MLKVAVDCYLMALVFESVLCVLRSQAFKAVDEVAISCYLMAVVFGSALHVLR